MAARRLIRDTCEIAAAIIDGKYDADLGYIAEAVQARKKAMYRKGVKVRLVGTKNPSLDGKVGTVLKVNATRISVGVGEKKTEGAGTPFAYEVWSDGEYNVPPSMLEIVGAVA